MTNPPTEHEIAVLAVYAQRCSVKETSLYMGLAESTVKNLLATLYRKLDVGSAMEACVAMGWVKVPERHEMCGWTGVCTRLKGHRGHHGGFRGYKQGRTIGDGLHTS